MQLFVTNPPKKFKKQGKLPGRPSELIRVALGDLKKVERQKKKFKIDMDTWVKPNGKCSVCMAGSVMVGTLKMDIESAKRGVVEQERDDEYSESFSPETGFLPAFFDRERKALEAINCFRTGDLSYGFAKIDIKWPAQFVTNIDVPAYSPRNPKKFHAAMNELADKLEEAGY